MKPLRRTIAWALLCVGVVASSPAFAQAVLTGTVTNAATGRALEGARVTLQGSDRQTLTDRQGSYRLENLPPGPAVLEVSYTGLDTITTPVTLNAGEPNQLEV